MPSKDMRAKKESEILPRTSGGMLSFDEFNHFFDDFLSRRWTRLINWNMQTLSEIGFPQVDIIDHDHDVEVQAALPGIKKENLDISINNQTITIRSCAKEEKKASIFAVK